jgi:aminopeptidase N
VKADIFPAEQALKSEVAYTLVNKSQGPVQEIFLETPLDPDYATKKGLDYFSKAFGPYQHRQFRVMEFPRYASFAQSFPNTVPFSEAIGFIAKVDPENPEDFNYPFLVTAHELAHQWWGHQVVGGNVQGSTLLSETLSQYSSAMVMEKSFGRDDKDKTLASARQSIKSGVNKIQLKFAQKPKSLILDPMQMWIDLNRDDNKVTL